MDEKRVVAAGWVVVGKDGKEHLMKRPFTLGIRYRLFLAFLAAACCVIASMFIVTRMSFERGAFRYIHAVEKERLEQLAQTLEQLYAAKGQWHFLQEEPTAWMDLVVETRPLRPLRLSRFQRLEGVGEGRGPTLQLEMPPPPVPKGEQFFELRVFLLDAKRQVLQGPPPPWPQPPHFVPLTLGDRTIGQLGLIPPRILVDVRIKQFVQEQHQALIVIALAIAASAALLSLPLASRLVRRITALATATNRLASGGYDVRVPVETGDELGQLARDFNRLAHTLARNEQLRRRWVADISHELRTPLAVLRGEVEAVQDGVRPLNMQTMDTLHAEILHLGRLVDDLYDLSLADIGAWSFCKQELDLAELLNRTVRSCREQFQARNLALHVDVPARPVVLCGDGERLRQLVNNLLANSLRYTDPGGRLHIELVEEGDNCVLRFMDSAPGVPDEALTRLFERFYRLEDSRNRAHGGAGLGLALCMSIVAGHGGTIRAVHADLGGLEIIVILPKRADACNGS